MGLGSYGPLFAALLAGAAGWLAASLALGEPIRDEQVRPAAYTTSGVPLQWRARKPHDRVAPREAPAPALLPATGGEVSLPQRSRAAVDPNVRPVQASAGAAIDPFDDFTAQPVSTPRLFSTSQVEPPMVPVPDPGTPGPAPFSPLDQLGQVAEVQLKVDCQAEYDRLRPIHEINNQIQPDAGPLPPECGLVPESYLPRLFAHTTYTWKASGVCHKPLYFEETALERYGHSTGKWSQPLVSGAHFFLTAPILPYKMGIDPPWECKYPLGYYRPGSCAPYMIPPLPISLRGAALQAGAVVGLVYILP